MTTAHAEEPAVEVRDAATLLLLDRSEAGTIRVLSGLRSSRHRFMGGNLVFPGGALDAGDRDLHRTGDPSLPPADIRRLADGNPGIGQAGAHALGFCAIRETYEEAGILVGVADGGFAAPSKDWQGFERLGIRPTLAGLRYVARAVTPPGRVRRFDTRFFAAWRDEVQGAALDGKLPTDELHGIDWRGLTAMLEDDATAPITAAILRSVIERLSRDPDLSADMAVPFFDRGSRLAPRSIE